MPPGLGDAIGKWEGDTLVVDTIEFNDKFWLDEARFISSDPRIPVLRPAYP